MSDQSPTGRLKGPVLVSACLLGIPCRYDGKSKPCPAILAAEGITPIPVCPEQLGGLPTPRASSQFVGGDGLDVLKGKARVIDDTGRDITHHLLHGAANVLKIVRTLGVTQAVLKDRSPSCGVLAVWMKGGAAPVPGMGVTAALLRENGITVFHEDTKL